MDLISNIRLFIKVAEKGNFSEVARMNNMSPASVTRQIVFLEKYLNTRLLQRNTRHVSLTDSGKEYYLKIVNLIEQLDEINESVNIGQSMPGGTIKISCPGSFAIKYIIPHVPEFYKLYPNVKLNFVLSDRMVNLVEEEIDVAIRIGKLKDSSMIIYPLTSNKRVICASPVYLDKAEKINNPNDLYKHNCLILSGMPVWYLFNDSQTYEIKPSGSIEVNNADALHYLTLEGLGISMLTMWLVKKDLENNKLKILFPDYRVNTSSSLDSEIYILYPNKNFLPLKVKVFINFIKKCIETEGLI